MIVAVPEQIAVEGASVQTWWRWWCSVCRVLASGARWSHAELALRQGDRHAAVEQCHVVGQLSLFGGAL